MTAKVRLLLTETEAAALFIAADSISARIPGDNPYYTQSERAAYWRALEKLQDARRAAVRP